MFNFLLNKFSLNRAHARDANGVSGICDTTYVIFSPEITSAVARIVSCKKDLENISAFVSGTDSAYSNCAIYSNVSHEPRFEHIRDILLTIWYINVLFTY